MSIPSFPLAVNIPTPTGLMSLECIPGNTIVIVGSNGAGKTRLGSYIEEKITSGLAHRLAAHRSLTLNPKVEAIDLERAESVLLYGYEGKNPNTRNGRRWNNKPNTVLLNDFDHLMRALYANHNDGTHNFMQAYMSSPESGYKPSTKILRLQTLWEKLLPHRKLKISPGDIKVLVSTSKTEEYSAEDLSDGERVIFYLLGQCLMVPQNGVFIIDEPEPHIHKAILPDLYDMIENERRDCTIIYLTHDLEFAASRYNSNKYIIHDYNKSKQLWSIERLSHDDEFSEELLLRIVGSRRPTILIEGEIDSLDAVVYRHVYENYTVLSIGSCETVIQAVKNLNKLRNLHRIECLGLIDGDYRCLEEKRNLKIQGIHVIPVSEIENLFLLPSVFKIIAEHLKYDPEEVLDQLKESVFSKAQKDLADKSLEFTKYQIDRKFKSTALNSKTISELEKELFQHLEQFKINDFALKYEKELLRAIEIQSLDQVLILYKNKGLLAVAAGLLGLKDRSELKKLIFRLISSKEIPLIESLRDVLPDLSITDHSAKRDSRNLFLSERR